MPKFAANVSTMYTEWPFLERFAAAAEDGFAAVEYQFAYEHPAAEIAARALDAGVQVVLLNAPPGNAVVGDRGLAAVPGREAAFRATIPRAIEYAQALQCPKVHVLAGVMPAGVERAACRARFVENIAWAAEQMRGCGIELMIEPINTRDVPGYFLNHQAEAHAIRAEIGSPALRVQMDFYHVQIMEGDLVMRLRRHAAGVGHVQIAGTPERHEPDTGEVNYDRVFETLDEVGYAGWVGCEYKPRTSTREGLGWLRRWHERPA